MGDLEGPEAQIKLRAIQALAACGFREIGTDGSGLRLLCSATGAVFIGVGSCRSLAYSPVGPGGRLQLVAARQTVALIDRITSLDLAALRAASASLAKVPSKSPLFPLKQKQFGDTVAEYDPQAGCRVGRKGQG